MSSQRKGPARALRLALTTTKFGVTERRRNLSEGMGTDVPNSYHWRLDTTRLVSQVVGEPDTSSGRTALQVLKALQILIYLDSKKTTTIN